jgi:hypothetical protein
MENENRKCVIRSKEYGGDYFIDRVSCQSGLYHAKIFDEKDIPEFMKNDNLRHEIIFLDSKKGLELLFNEIKMLDSRIPQEENFLNEMKNGRDKLYNSNPEMISEIIKKYNRNTSGGLIHVSPETEKEIIEEIVKNN